MFTHDALIAETDSLRKFAMRLTGNKVDADDLLQSTFLRMLEKGTYFESETSLRKWGSKIMFNIFVTGYRRKTKFETQYDPEPYIQAMSIRPTQDDTIELACVGDAIETLSEDHKDILTMICIKDLSYQEVSEALNIPVGTVRSRLSRAREQLQNVLDTPQPRNTTRTYMPPAYVISEKAISRKAA
jgi:RNA polymerase sigma-70 factor (ECF subfamily)